MRQQTHPNHVHTSWEQMHPFLSLKDTGTSGVVWEAVAPSAGKMHPSRPGGRGSCRERQELLVVVAASDVKSARLGTRMGALTSLR